MTPDALHTLTHHPAALIIAWTLGGAGPVIGWILAMGLVGKRSRPGRAAAAVGAAVFVLPLGWMLVRLAVLARGGGLPGLLDLFGTPAGGWHPNDAIVLLVLPFAFLHLIAVELLALLERYRAPRDLAVPLALPVAALCIGAAFIGSIAAAFSLQQPLTELVSAEVFAFAPVVLVALGIWTQARDAIPVQTQTLVVETPEALEHLDIPQQWTAVGALLPGARSFLKRQAVVDDTTSAGSVIWASVGGQGGCPESIDSLATDGIPPNEVWQIGDLPAPTEHLVVMAAVSTALRNHGRQVLVICEDPEARVAHLERTDRTAGGYWPVGPSVAGLAALRKVLAEGRFPAVAFLSTQDLSAGGIRTLAKGPGSVWARTLGLLVLEGFDRGGPMAVTHRVHSLRRLRLVLEQRRVGLGVLVTSLGSRAVRVLVQQSFPGVSVQQVPLRARQTRALTVWLADYHFVMRSPAGWVRQAAEPVAAASHRVRVSDPSGSFDDNSLAVWQGDVSRTPTFTLEGEASIGLLDAPALIGAWRALPHQVSATDDLGRHHALWSLIDEPVTRYLLGEDRLARLEASGELPAPAAIAALSNPLVAGAHLRAALHEADQERAALVAVFGNQLVDQLAPGGDAEGYAVRSTPDGITRTPRLPRTPEDPGDPMGATGQTTAIVDRETGRVLQLLSALTAPTRYYPRRVFALGGQRFAVPSRAEPTRRIEVEPVAPEVALTRPKLTIQITSRGVREAEQRHTRGRFSYHAAIHQLLAVEIVDGARSADGALVEYEAVQTRYLTAGRVITFEAKPSANALAHLAASFGDTLRALLLLHEDDTHAAMLPPAWGPRPGFVVIERAVQGLGVAEVLDERRVARTFDWVAAILSACGCDRGCENCTPASHVATGRLDKGAVIRLLKGAS